MLKMIQAPSLLKVWQRACNCTLIITSNKDKLHFPIIMLTLCITSSMLRTISSIFGGITTGNSQFVITSLLMITMITSIKTPSLAWLSEQALESSHLHFKDTWKRYKSTSKSKNGLLFAVKDVNNVRNYHSFSS